MPTKLVTSFALESVLVRVMLLPGCNLCVCRVGLFLFVLVVVVVVGVVAVDVAVAVAVGAPACLLR